MAVDITALYCCLDDFCQVLADWEAHRLIPSEQTRQRTGKLSGGGPHRLDRNRGDLRESPAVFPMSLPVRGSKY
jgi:hypothetical protein